MNAIALRPEPQADQLVFERGGRVFANSQDVAAHFGKQHAHVLRQIRELIDAGCASNFGATSTAVAMPNGGVRDEPSYDMDRDGFSLLVMSFTGKKALAFKVQYIAAFNAMEAELRDRPATLNLLDPVAVRAALLEFSTRLVEAQAANAALAPKAAGFDRIATADGPLCITDSAKTLQVRPSALFAYLSQHGWIYQRGGVPPWIGYQVRVQAGLLTHKVAIVTRKDGSEKAISSVLVTPRGLTRLAEILAAERVAPPPPAPAAGGIR